MERFAWHRWQALFSEWTLIVDGLGQTVRTSVLALALSLALGILVGVLATAPLRPARWFNRVYVDLVQNTPLVTQVMFFFYALPHLRIHVESLWVGVLALGIYHGAYMAEVVRAGIQSIHRGQLEAAYSQGFTYVQAMRYIILPQAAQVVLPPMTNQVVSLIKNSAVLYVISGYDLMHQLDSWASYGGNYGPAYLTAWAIYFAICFSLATVAGRLERRFARARGGEVRAG